MLWFFPKYPSAALKEDDFRPPMAPTACGSAAIFIDSTACCCTLVCSNSKNTIRFPRRANPPWAVPHWRACCHISCMSTVCSVICRHAPVCFNSKRRPLAGANPSAGDTPAARAPRRPCGARAFRPRDAGRTGGRSQPPARGRRAGARRCAAPEGQGGRRLVMTAKKAAWRPPCGRHAEQESNRTK